MQFSVNYSPQAANLLKQGAITVDRLKCPDWPKLIAQARDYRPVYVHFPLQAGAPQPPQVDWDFIRFLRGETNTPAVNLHLAANAAEYPQIPHESDDPVHLDEIAANMVRDVRASVERFGAQNVIVENAPYHGTSGHPLRASVEPAVIRHVVEETGCGFLLDISHALITAHYLGMDGQAYLSALPVDRLYEAHVTGIHLYEGRLRDHLPMTARDWAMLDWVLDRISRGGWAEPWMLAFEYGGVGPPFEWRSDAQVIAEQVPQLQRRVNTVHTEETQ